MSAATEPGARIPDREVDWSAGVSDVPTIDEAEDFLPDVALDGASRVTYWAEERAIW